MRTGLIILLSVCWMPLAWAAYQTIPGKPLDLGALTSEAKAVVPDLEGCDDTVGTITCRRLTGDFTDAEKGLLDQVIAAHDAQQARQKRQEQSQETEIPLGDFGAGAAGALAILAGRELIISAKKKRAPPTTISG